MQDIKINFDVNVGPSTESRNDCDGDEVILKDSGDFKSSGNKVIMNKRDWTEEDHGGLFSTDYFIGAGVHYEDQDPINE